MSAERERPSHFSVYRDAAYLSLCSASESLDWLKNRPIEYSRVFGTPNTPPESHALEYILYRRNLPLIDLALAEHGRSKSVVERVYKRADAATRVTACGNPSLFVGDTITFERGALSPEKGPLYWNIVRDGPLSELRAICENPHLRSGFYGNLVSSWQGDENSNRLSGEPLSDERFKRVLSYLSRNPRIATCREDSEERHYWDGGSDYDYNKLFTKCWKLAEILPVVQEWAYVLSKLYRRLYKPFDVIKDVDAVLERWRPKDNEEGDMYPTVSVREEIAAKFLEPSLAQSDSNDVALRRAFYRTFDPERREFRDINWTDWLERDRYCEIELNQNEKIWRSARGRSKLEALLWEMSKDNNEISQVGFFKEDEEKYRKSHPHWFKDEEIEETHLDEDE